MPPKSTRHSAIGCLSADMAHSLVFPSTAYSALKGLFGYGTCSHVGLLNARSSANKNESL